MQECSNVCMYECMNGKMEENGGMEVEVSKHHCAQ